MVRIMSVLSRKDVKETALERLLVECFIS